MKEVSIVLLHLCRMLFCYMLSLCDCLAAAPGYHILEDFVIVSDMGSLSPAPTIRYPASKASVLDTTGIIFFPSHERAVPAIL